MATRKNLTWREVRDLLNAIDPSQLDKTAAVQLDYPSTDEVFVINSTGFVKDDDTGTEFVLVSAWEPPVLNVQTETGITYPAGWKPV